MGKKIYLNTETYKKGTQLLSAKFPDGEINTKFDYDYLNDITSVKFTEGIKRIIQEYKYRNYPSIATIRHYCGYDLTTISKQAINKTLFKAIKRVRDTKTLCFVDKALNAVANRYGGHRVMQFWTQQDWLFNQKAMVELYDSYVRTGTREIKVLGSFEANIDFKQAYDTYVVWQQGDETKGKIVQFDKNCQLIHETDRKWLKVIEPVTDKKQIEEAENYAKAIG